MKNKDCGKRGRVQRNIHIPQNVFNKQVLISKKHVTNQSSKKESMSSNEGNHVKSFPESKPVGISVTFSSHMPSQEDSRNQPINGARME